MNPQEYIDPIMKKYADLIKTGNGLFKRVYFGEPIRIGASELPALIIAKVGTNVGNLTNAEDMHSLRLSFTIVSDVRDTISDDKEMVHGVNSLYNLMEGRDDTTYQLKANSLLYILRHNVELDIANNLRTDISTMTTVDYGMTMGKRQEGMWSIEGTVEIIANFTQVR